MPLTLESEGGMMIKQKNKTDKILEMPKMNEKGIKGKTEAPCFLSVKDSIPGRDVKIAFQSLDCVSFFHVPFTFCSHPSLSSSLSCLTSTFSFLFLFIVSFLCRFLSSVLLFIFTTVLSPLYLHASSH